jgi:hypothetical protein
MFSWGKSPFCLLTMAKHQYTNKKKSKKYTLGSLIDRLWHKRNQRIKSNKFYTAVVLSASALALVTAAQSLAIQRIAEAAVVKEKSVTQWKLEQEARRMTVGYPINPLLTHIFTKDQVTAAYLIGIAKKESNWGKISPKKDGRDCYNYWGFKGKGSNGVAAGHTCFGSPEEAVDAVASRISSLVYDYNRTTPEQLVVWKCGYSCHGHSQASVDKWISDVAFYKNHLESAKN